MLTARHAAIRLLKLMMVASLVLPAVLFAFAATVSYRNFERVADERIDRSLDILHEHALKVLQTVERTFAEIDEVVRGMSDDDIRRNEVMLHARLKRIDDALPQVQGIAIIDRSGNPLVSANLFPVQNDINLSDRDYFKAQESGNAGTYVSSVHEPRMGGFGGYFFALSQRRQSDDGKFNGIVSVAVLPNYFEDFYAKMGRTEGSYYASCASTVKMSRSSPRATPTRNWLCSSSLISRSLGTG
jgi:two-component system, NtrC family, sensor kinase